MARTSPERFAWTDGLVVLPHCNFIMQGVNTERSVSGDTIRGQVNEELHDADNWIPGRLEQAYGRTTAFWNSVILNISNASHKRDQLHQAFLAGTQQEWQVRCPGCGQYHTMRTHWEETKPELGGLRYDMAGSRLEDGEVGLRQAAADDPLPNALRLPRPRHHRRAAGAVPVRQILRPAQCRRCAD
jgi:hypothetical protein